MNRRQVLKMLGGVAGAAAAGRFALLPPSASASVEGAQVIARRLYESLDEEQRRSACVEYGHPYRQYHNRGVWGGGLWVNPLSIGMGAAGDQTRYELDNVVGELRKGPIRTGDIYTLESGQDEIGGIMVRDAVIAHLEKHGFPTPASAEY